MWSRLQNRCHRHRRAKTLGAVDYVRQLEEVLIRTCADFGIPTRRVKGLTGAWTEAEPASKIAAIGVHISRSVTSHGFALNVNTDLGYFNLIVPCGITAKPVTSMQKESGARSGYARGGAVGVTQFRLRVRRQVLWVETIEALLGNIVGLPIKAPDRLAAAAWRGRIVAKWLTRRRMSSQQLSRTRVSAPHGDSIFAD